MIQFSVYLGKQWNYIGEDSYAVVGGHLHPRYESKYLCGGC